MLEDPFSVPFLSNLKPIFYPEHYENPIKVADPLRASHIFVLGCSVDFRKTQRRPMFLDYLSVSCDYAGRYFFVKCRT